MERRLLRREGKTMANMIDYVRWRGDIPFHQVPLGEVDALVLSYLSYMPFGSLVSADYGEKTATIAQVAAYFYENGLSSSCMIDSEESDCLLMDALRTSVRFGSVQIAGFADRYDEKTQEQFSAVTFMPETGPAFIAFRGTDSTVVGWKEDFNMSFSREVPAQRTALAYAAQAIRVLDRPVILGGHSKGGNLAAYAGVFAPEDVQADIQCIYNFDGPGFNEQVFALPEFKRLNMRIHTFVPQSSMIGILLWHAEPFTVVRSDAGGLLQHNPYSWQVMGGRMLTLPERTNESRFAEETIKHWLSELQPEARSTIIDGIYSVLSASDGRNISDLFEAKNVRAILRAVGTMDEETKDVIVDAFRRLGSSLKETIPDWLDRTTDQLFTMIAQKATDKEMKRELKKENKKENNV